MRRQNPGWGNGDGIPEAALREATLSGPTSPMLDTPETQILTFAQVNDDSVAGPGSLLAISGVELGLNPRSDNTAVLLVSIDGGGVYQSLVPGSVIRAATRFHRVFLKRPAAIAATAAKSYVIDAAPRPQSLPYATTPQVSVISMPSGLLAAQVQGTAAAGVAPLGNPIQLGAQGVDGFMHPIQSDNTGKLFMNPITGQAGVAANAGVLSANTQRVAIATNDGVRSDLDTLAGVVTGARAAVNPIAAQVGIQGDRGVATALTTRVTIATDDTISASATLVQGLAAADTLTEIADTPTAGVGFVELVAAVAAKRIYPTTITLSNEDTIAHAFLLMRNGGAGTVIQRWVVPAGGSFTFDGRGDVRSGVNEDLGVKLGEAIGTVQPHVSGAAVIR